MNSDFKNNFLSKNEDVLGMVVSGSLTNGVEVKLNPDRSVSDIKIGRYVAIETQDLKFFGVVTDIALGATDQTLRVNPPEVSNPFIANVIKGTTAYGVIQVEPMLILSQEDFDSLSGPQPAKTIPPHFSQVSFASDLDVETVFGLESDTNFWLGNPLDMDSAKLCLNIEELIKRSNGVFGKSGTGKTFLTRLLLLGIIQRGAASQLVFDMQSEYGWKGFSEESKEVKGLKQIFPSKVAIFSLDEESSKRRGVNPDYVVRIGYEDIEPGDISVLKQTLNLSDIAADAAYSLERYFGPSKWFKKFISLSGGEEFIDLARDLNVNQSALSSLKNRLSRFKRFNFMDELGGNDSVSQILSYLDRGMHVILEFGRYGSDLAAYMLVANLLTRRIYARYAISAEKALGDPTQQPTPLVITIEEAHKFLSSDIASQTIFGTIAREMRKHNVTLLVVDQRPSSIDEEIMSQLGTKITCLLDNEKDLDSVLTGISGNRKLRSVLSRLESKQQALIFGHSVPMPMVIKVRDYGTAISYGDFQIEDVDFDFSEDNEDLFGKKDNF